MVGIVLVSHGGMADGMMTSAPMLYPDFCQCESLTLWPEDNPDEFQAKLEAKVKEVDTGDGVFILADLLGGTPCNRSMYLLGDRVRVLSGLSMPMLVTLLSTREDTSDLDEITSETLEMAKVGTVDVNELMKQRGLNNK
ncbi:MAG: PTS sugar transporter subunit IIA [Oscillospiraceae bacterium]|nr:PTS sugar transporter subunit IIA [Oscillospiraceae bacterium]